MSLENKRRNRLILVCNNCHKKKIKCDRKLPCSSCLKLSIGPTCFYNAPTYKQNNKTPNWSTTPESLNVIESGVDRNSLSMNRLLIKQIDRLKSQVKALENSSNIYKSNVELSETNTLESNRSDSVRELENLSSNEILFKVKNTSTNYAQMGVIPVCSSDLMYSFHNSLQADPENENEIMVHPPQPTSMITLPKGDPVSKLILNYLSNDLRKGQDFFSVYSKDQILNRETVDMLEKKSIDYYGDKYIKRLGKVYNDLEANFTKRSISLFGLDVGITFSEKDLLRLALGEQIKSVLPPIRAITLLIKYFFKFLYKSFPFLMEETFIEDVKRILGSDLDVTENSFINHIILKNNEDLAVSTILISILRASYLSLLDISHVQDYDETYININERDYLLKYPIPIDAVSVLDRSLAVLDIDQKPKFCILQAILFTYIYHLIAPEQGYLLNTFEVNPTFGKIILQAMQILLHRDPSYEIHWKKRELDSDKERYFKKRFWYMLVLMDMENSIVMGSAPFISTMHYDTEFPKLPEDDLLKYFDQDELKIINSLLEVQKILTFGRQIIEEVFPLKATLKLSYLIQRISEFEIAIKDHLGELNDFLTSCNHNLDILKLLKFRIYLYFKFLLLYLYYSIFLYFEKKNNEELSFFFLKKIHYTAFFELAGITSGFTENCEYFFGPSSTMVLKPIVLIINRFQMLSCILRVRIKCSLLFNDETKVMEEKLNSITSNLVFMEEEGAKFVYKANKKNMYAWWYCKGYRFGQNMILDKNFYIINEEDSKRASLSYSSDKYYALDDMLKIFKVRLLSLKEYYKKLQSDGKRNSISNYNEDHDIELMEQVQIDKMWMLFQTLKIDWKEKQFKKEIFGITNDEYLLTESIISLETSSDELWKVDLDVIKSFMADDLFLSN